LISPGFYRVAAPVDVEKILLKVTPTEITQRKVTDRFPGQGGFPSNFGSSLVKGALLPMFKLETYSVDPMPVALTYSAHPEVIAMLAQAGCPMRDRVMTYLHVWPLESRPLPVSPEILAVLLRYESSPENSSFLLTRLLLTNDTMCPPEALKVFLAMTKNLDMHDDRSFAHSAVKGGSLEKLRLILDAGADPNYAMHDNTPLELARETGRQDMVKALISAGAGKDKNSKR
jgi:hypothetical protein